MGRICILKAVSAEDAGAPEFRYLNELVAAEAGRVFAGVSLRVGPAASEALEGGDADCVLAIGEANVLVCRASLRRMREVLLGGADVAVPVPVASIVAARRGRPLYTLRQFEDLEREWLAEGAQAPAEAITPSHLPVALWRGEAFRRARERFGGERLFLDPALLSQAAGLRAARAGLYHAFIDYYGQCREDVLPYVPASVREVLEIGCGRGATGAMLRERIGCRVTGVEQNPVVAEAARANLDRVVQGDAAAIEWDGAYDAVIALELLEHLPEPEPFLRKIRGAVRRGGRIVLSVPNAGHYAVVADLLAGRWDYLPIGLLCYTHVRFFTRRTLEDLFMRCGFERWELTPQTTELPDEMLRLRGALPGVDEESLRTKGFFAVLQ